MKHLHKFLVALALFGLSAGATTAFAQTYNIGDPVATDVKAVISGSGNNLTLTISGTGKMMDWYDASTVPWYSIGANIKTLVINEGVTSIGNYAFFDCSGFTGSLTIPNSVTTIGSYAFFDCSGFTGSLTIPNSVTSIGSAAFDYCRGFTGTLTIPNSVTTIGSYAFFDCSGFTGSLTIPNSVTSIGSAAFYNCSGFTGSLTIGNAVTNIGEGAFANCSGLIDINVDTNNVNYSSDNGILYNKNKTTLIQCPAGKTGVFPTIPNSVTTIGNNAFDGCSGFTGTLTIPNSVISIGDGAFDYCSGFTGTLTIPNSVTTIGSYAFYYCSGFTGSLTIPNSVTTIGYGAFWNCSGFTGSLTIGNSVTTIGNSAFFNCKGFIKVINLNKYPQNVNSDVFYEVNLSSVTLVVPACALEDYQIAEVWSSFGTITGDEGLPCEGTNNIETIKANNITIYPNPTKEVLIIKNEELRIENYSIFNVSGQILMQGALSTETTTINVKSLPSGMYFVKVENKTGKFVKE